MIRQEIFTSLDTLSTLGVIVGRFQVADLHEGHRALFDHVLAKHRHVLVVTGNTATKGSQRNPLDFGTRFLLLTSAFDLKVARGELLVKSLNDQQSDAVWSENLDALIEECSSWWRPVPSRVVLYGSRDSFIPHYSGKHETSLFEAFGACSGTEARKEIARAPLSSIDFRKGVIYATQNRFPISYQAVDIAIVRQPANATEETHVLLGRKPGEMSWRFPGGFVDPTDMSLEHAAAREAKEETGVDVKPHTLKYIASMRVNDWRYRSETDKIMTSFYRADSFSGLAFAGDDLEEVRWFPLSQLITRISEVHLGLVYQLINSIKPIPYHIHE